MQFFSQSATWLFRLMFKDWQTLGPQARKRLLFHLVEFLMVGAGRRAYWIRNRALLERLYDLLLQAFSLVDHLTPPAATPQEPSPPAEGQQPQSGESPATPGGDSPGQGQQPATPSPERIISALK